MNIGLTNMNFICQGPSKTDIWIFKYDKATILSNLCFKQ